MKRCVLYARVSTYDQNPGMQLLELRELAQQRGFTIVNEYVDYISGAKAKRQALDQMLSAAHRREFDVLMIWAADRLARSVRHFLEVLDTLNNLGIEFISRREQLDTSGPLGRAVIVIVSAIAELERSLIVERVKAGMRRAKLEGRRIGRRPLDIDRPAVVRDREHGMSLTEVAKIHRISRAMVSKILREARHKGCAAAPVQVQENKPPMTAA
jgi:DNA invertase Pin-like site-specific DNA recombinase